MTSTSLNSPADLVDLEGGRIHKLAYTDLEIFDLEMEKIWSQTWLYVAHTSELPSKGDYKTMTILGRPLVIVRGADGSIRALENRCRHRGASVCQHATGNARFFRCEYHGWTYKNNGELVGVTYSDAYEGMDKSQLGLPQVPRIDEYNGLVFISFNPDVISLDEHLGEAKNYIDLFFEQGAGHAMKAAFGTQKIKYDGNWKYQLENGVDGYHPNFAHRSFFRIMGERTGVEGLGSYMDGSANAESRAIGNGHSLIDQRTTASGHYAERYKASPDVDEILEKLREELPEKEIDRLLEKSTSAGFNLSVYPNLQLIGLHIREIRPQSAHETVVHYTPMAVDGVPDGINQLRLRNHELFYSAAGMGVPDDGEMFRRVNTGIKSEVDWVLLQRGLNRETTENGITTGHITDETTQRGQWAQWLKFMTKEAE